MDVRKVGFIPIILLAVLFPLMIFLRTGENLVFKSPTLLLALNLLFLTVFGIAIAAISARSYLIGGSITVLLLGIAASILGLAAAVAGWAAGISVNDDVAVFTIGALLSGMFQVFSAIMLTNSLPAKKSIRKKGLLIGYLLPLTFFLIISAIALAGYAPAFYNVSGPTLTRQWVLWGSILLFATSSIIFALQYRKTGSQILYWYTLALALLAIALFGSATYTVPNSLFNWLAMLSQYFAGCYFLITLLVLRRVESYQVMATTMTERWADAFANDPRQIDALFGNISDGFALCKIECDQRGKPIDFIFLDVNDAFERLTGLKKENILGRRATEVMPGIERDPADWIGVYGKIALEEESSRFEAHYEQLRGWYDVSAYSPRRGYFVILFTDITAQKRTNEALHLSEERLMLALKGSQEGVWDWNLETNAVWYSHRWKEMLGYSDFEIEPNFSVFEHLLHPDDRERYNEMLKNAMQGKQDYKIELRLRHKDGHYVDVLTQGFPVRQALGGKIVRLVGTHLDLTEQRKAEWALRESEERFSKAFNASPVSVILTRYADGYIVDANETCLRLLGYTLDDAIGHTTEELNLFTYPDGRKEYVHFLDEAQGQLHDFEMTLRTKTGRLVNMILSSERISLNGQDHIVSVLLDITERKKDEESLREREQLYKTIFDNSEDGFHLQELLYDDNWRVADARSLKVNPAFEKQTGLRGADIIGRRVSEYAPNIKQSQLEVLDNVLKTGKPMHVESFNQDTSSYYDVYYFPYSNNAVGGLFRDITERKKLEEQIEQRAKENALERQRLYNVLEGLPAMVCLLTPDYHVAFANRPFREKHGESHGRRCYEYCRGSGRTVPCNDCKSYVVLATGKPNRWELNLEDGTIFDAYSFPFTDLDGSPMVLEMDLDITEQKRAEAEIKKYREHLEDLVRGQTDELRRSRDELERRVEERTETVREQAELLDKANDGILIIDLKGYITYWNKGAEKIYGWSRKEAIGRNANELLQADPLQIAEAIRITISSSQWIGEIKPKTKDGRDLIIESSWTLVRDAEKKPRSIMTIDTDITEKKQLEMQYLRAQRLESLGTLAGGIAHDFRNILTPIMISLNLLDQRLTTKEDQALIAMLQGNVKRGADLSGRLLTFTKGMESDRVLICVPALILDIAKTIKETFPRFIFIETMVSRDLPAVMGDNTQLHQVLINLCINARDAMPFGGTLTITAENASVDQQYAKMHPEAKVGSYVTISVRDNGLGMTPEVKERLFEPFFTTKKLGEGTGLGLSTSRSIMKGHGGFIEVYSELGKGSTFKLYLPAGEVKCDQMEGPVDVASQQGEGQLILVVDDEGPIRVTTAAVLKNNGYGTIEAADGTEALGIYTEQKGKIKAVLLDMAMPVMDGVATIRALKRIAPDVKIIGMSGLAEDSKYAAVYTATNAFITKPFTAETLLKTVARVMVGPNNGK